MVEAATTNASCCDAVCRALGLPTRWAVDAWTVAERSPGGYPDAVTLSREAEAAAVLKRVEDGSGCSIKDSFAVLDLGPSGFHVLFEATWIQRPTAGAGSAARSTGAACKRRRTSNSGPRVTDSMSSFLPCWRATIFGFMALDRLMVPALR